MKNSGNKVSVFWFRRDLRLFDNPGLFRALKSKNRVLPVFIFDRNIGNLYCFEIQKIFIYHLFYLPVILNDIII